MKTRGSIRAVVVAVAVSFAGAAGAQEDGATSSDPMRQPGGLFDATPKDRKNQLSLWGSIGWGAGLGAGVRYAVPIMPNGLLPELNESIELEPGVDLYFWGLFGLNQTTIDIPVEARWTFHLLPNVSVYAKVTAGLSVTLVPNVGAAFGGLFDILPGLIYRLGDTVVLRAEAGYRGFRAGIGFEF